ncbi:hypothetical protein AALO_G00224850 [Alosa alosa]|uniref:Ig-like domain-containing protein n=1 Tax=Alosa alosa TaxID=278164 RepID=A0AAV6G2J3_9TELE|nr:uncharacterized protein LOC125310272 [Alosa alosa]KAG5267717.1 hypothetical protein AALO_G00224850 [Alosa alosa]
MKVLCLALTVILFSAAALVSAQDVQHVTVDFWKNFTLTCDLTMHTDIAAQQPLNISWEAMGKDVVRYDGNMHYGSLFQNRASATWDDGKLSVTLHPVVLSDADVYECLWHGRKTLRTVIITVLETYYEEDIFVRYVNDSVRLPCWGIISKSRTLEKVSVYWKKNGKDLYSLVGGRPPNPPSFMYNNAFMSQDLIQEYGELSLFIENLSPEDTGTYKCWYSDDNFAAVPGIPGSVELTVLDYILPTEIDPFVVSDNSSSSPTSYPTMADQEQEEVWPEMQGTSVPETSPGAEETVPPLPWVRIGIISGVLIITALVMGPLVAMGKI